MGNTITIRPALPPSLDWRSTSDRPTGLQHHFKANSERTSSATSASIAQDRQKEWHDLVVKSAAQQAWRGRVLK